MKLNPLERVTLLNMMPMIQKGNHYIYKLVTDLMSQCSISQEEIDTLKIERNADGGIKFPPESFKATIDIEIPPVLIARIREVILAINKTVRPMQEVAQQASLVDKIYPTLALDLAREEATEQQVSKKEEK